MMKQAYSRCNSGHYFAAEACPLDGWTSDGVQELSLAVRQLSREGRELSIQELLRTGVSHEALARTIVIDFGTPSSVFELLAPEGYYNRGEYQTMPQVGHEYK